MVKNQKHNKIQFLNLTIRKKKFLLEIDFKNLTLTMII